MASLTSTTSSPAPLGDFPEPDAVPCSAVTDDRFYEVVEGLVVRSLPMGASETEIAFLIAFALNQIVKPQKLGKVVIELLFHIDAKRELKRRPDIAFVSAKKWPVGKRVPKGEAWDMVPDLAVEVVSESNTAQEVIQKVVDYLSTGSRQVWVVYPDLKQVHVYTDLTSAQILTEPAVLDGGDLIPGFRLSLTELFEDADSAALTPAGD
jgi:Uma2 family endonuclease